MFEKRNVIGERIRVVEVKSEVVLELEHNLLGRATELFKSSDTRTNTGNVCTTNS